MLPMSYFTVYCHAPRVTTESLEYPDKHVQERHARGTSPCDLWWYVGDVSGRRSSRWRSCRRCMLAGGQALTSQRSRISSSAQRLIAQAPQHFAFC